MRHCKILWSTQSGRAKSCARRTKRILSEKTMVEIADMGFPFDDTPEPFIEWVSNRLSEENILLLFVSTTGDGEQCDAIQGTWKTLLNKSLRKDLFAGKHFALFCLGDRAYGDQFCAAGRKLAVRLLQLGMRRYCQVGYGDDNTPNGGVFRDLDDWLEQQLLPKFDYRTEPVIDCLSETSNPFFITWNKTEDSKAKSGALEEWEEPLFASAYDDYFAQTCPLSAYVYDSNEVRTSCETEGKIPPLVGEVVSNQRITARGWEQDTRHIRIILQSNFKKALEASEIKPYKAGDIATILPFNSDEEVDKFLDVLPEKIRLQADRSLTLSIDKALMNASFIRWPLAFTLRGWLKHCADIHALPEREDLRALSFFCSEEHVHGKDEAQKLRSLSETSETALYADYILSEKRSWTDVLFDFESLRSPSSSLSVEYLLALLPAMRPRDFSIASSPSLSLSIKTANDTFMIELTVAIVKGRTRLNRSYHGLCSEYLSRMVPKMGKMAPKLRIWIRPGKFKNLPFELLPNGSFKVPVLCVGAGTGIAPMRSILQERDAVKALFIKQLQIIPPNDSNDNILIFGCRKENADFYYENEWKGMSDKNSLRIMAAFSRDQFEKRYVQMILQEADNGSLIARHLLERGGALYIAGGPQMARAVKAEVLEGLGKVLDGGKREASQILIKLQRLGKFSIETWS